MINKLVLNERDTHIHRNENQNVYKHKNRNRREITRDDGSKEESEWVNSVD